MESPIIATVNASSSSAAGQPSDNLFDIDLTAGRLPALPTAFLADQDLDLLAPVQLWPFKTSPAAPSPNGLVDRAAFAQALGAANVGYGHPKAQHLADKLANPETRVVVTGQQPGLLGGPLMGLSKTVAAVLHAEALEAEGIPAIAVFWVATEDHDWAEVARATVLDRSTPQSVEIGEDLEPLSPVGPRPLGAGMEEVRAQLGQLLHGDDAVARLEQVFKIYRPDNTVGNAFIELMIKILGERAPLYLDSLLPAVKQFEVPVMRALIDKRAELDAAYSAADQAVLDRNRPLQVTPQPGVSPLFLIHDGERRRIEWRGEHRFGLRGAEEFEADVEQLVEILETESHRVSPGVLARPAVQDALLGTTLSVLGPAELSYMVQAKATHALLGLDEVHTTLRPQTLTLEGRHASWLEELGLPLADLLGKSVDEALAERLGVDVVTPVREQIAAQLEILKASVLEIDKSLEKPLRKTGDQIDRGLDMLSSKIAAAVGRRHEVWQKRLEQMRSTLNPGGSLQERKLATAFLWARHGDALIDALFAQMDLDPRRLSVIRLGG